MATSAATGGFPPSDASRLAPTSAEPSEAVADDDGVMIVDSLRRTPMFGLRFVNAPDLEPVVDAIMTTPARDDDVVPALLTPNVDIVVHLDRAPGSVEAEMFRRAQYCLPDGAPLVWVSRWLSEPLGARLPGSGLFEALWPRVASERVPCVVVASSDDIAERLKREHPEADVVIPPMFDADDDSALTEIAEQILAAAAGVEPRLVLVGIGNPKDARIIANLLDRWPADLGPKPLCLGLGGSFAMYLGLKRRAPGWVQRIGMEWFFRFAQEPRRLFHRYFVQDMAFIAIVWRAWRARPAKDDRPAGIGGGDR